MARYRKFLKVEDLQQKIDEYFLFCDQRTKTVVAKNGQIVEIPAPRPYTIEGLAVFLDLTTETLRQYEMLDKFSATIKKAKAKILANKVEGMISGDWNAAGVIFDLKNNHGWKDKFEREDTVSKQITLKFEEQQGNEQMNDF